MSSLKMMQGIPHTILKYLKDAITNGFAEIKIVKSKEISRQRQASLKREDAQERVISRPQTPSSRLIDAPNGGSQASRLLGTCPTGDVFTWRLTEWNKMI